MFFRGGEEVRHKKTPKKVSQFSIEKSACREKILGVRERMRRVEKWGTVRAFSA